MIPAWLGLGMSGVDDWLHNGWQFRGDVVEQARTVLIVGKRVQVGRRSNPNRYFVDLADPFGGGPVEWKVDAAVHDAAVPHRDCASIVIQRGSNGAVRLRRVEDWKVPCRQQVSG